MALLRLSNGEIYTDLKTINQLIAPVEIGTFEVPADVAKAVSDPDLKFNRAFANLMHGTVVPKAKETLKQAGFDPKETRLAVYVPPKTANDPHQFIALLEGEGEIDPAPLREEDFAAYLVPHRFPVNDWHFCFAGTMAKGLLLENGVQATLYIFGGEWMKLKPTVLNWPIFQKASPIVGLSFFEEEANEHGAYDMDLVPDFQPEESVRF